MNNKYLSLFRSMLYIECYYDTDINAHELSELIDMPVNNFNRMFKSFYGLTPKQFITKCRLRNACFYITTTDRSFLNIAVLCGFNNLSQFYRSFKKNYKMTPTEFKYRQRGNCML